MFEHLALCCNNEEYCCRLVAGRTAVQLCVEPQIVNFLSKTSHSSAASTNKKSQQVCTMLEKQMIFAWALNPNDTEKLFLKLQVRASVCQSVSMLCTGLLT